MMCWRSFAAVGALSLLVSSPTFGQSTATVSGTLTDAITAMPLVGEVPGFVVVYDSAGRFVAGGSTDSAGHYRILVENLVAGTYFVRAGFAPGYIPKLHRDIVCVAVDCPVTVGTPVVLQAGTAATIDFALSRGGTITGLVRRASDGAGIPHFAVHVYNASTSLVTMVASDEGGAYSVTGLPAGTYFARVAPFGATYD